MKKNLILVGIIISTIVLAALSVITAIRIRNLGTRPVAPSAPESKPKAVGEIPDNITPVPACQITAQVVSPTPTLTPSPGPSSTPTPTPTPGPSSTPTPTPTPGPSSTPTPGPSSTPTPGPSSTPAPGPSSTPGPTSTPRPTTIVQQPSPTEVTLPQAGIKIPTLGGILAGFLLIALGAALVF